MKFLQYLKKTNLSVSAKLAVAEFDNVLDMIMNELKQLLKPNAKMVLSGILDEKEYIVQAAIEREELKLVERIVDGHWVGLVVSL